MLDSKDLIISAPNITPAEVKSLLGCKKQAVVDVCTSPNINQWSRYKPIYLNETTWVTFHFREVGYDPSLHGLYAKSYSTWTRLADAVVSNGTLKAISDWSYQQETIKKNNIPKRLGDFDGYYHKATPEFVGFYCPPELGNKTTGALQKAYLLPAVKSTVGADSNTDPGSIGLAQINAPDALGVEATTLDNFYFGVVLINAATAAVKWALSESAISDLNGGNLQHTYEVPMSITSVAAGTYVAVPVLTRKRVSSMQDTPQQICIVPNCSPTLITVKDSSVVNEDLEVVFTSCRFIPSLADNTTGIVSSDIRVESKGTYTKKCSAECYIVFNGETTHQKVYTENFNLGANGVYTFNYSVSLSAAEASGMTVYVTVKANRSDGISTQTITVMRAPVVPIQ